MCRSVNEIFDPGRVDSTYHQAPGVREAAIAQDRGTNYGVVRLELLEHIYADMYTQRLQEQDEGRWAHRILPDRQVERVKELPDGSVRLLIRRASQTGGSADTTETMDVDAVLVATGYVRDAHEDILRRCRHLGADETRWAVGRDYRVALNPAMVSDSAGLWLQGCNESTHGVCMRPSVEDILTSPS